MLESFGRDLSSRRAFAIVAIAAVVGTVACDCNGDEPDEVEPPDEVAERDRDAEIPEPDFAGVAPDDFDPDDKSRVVDVEHWNVSMRAVGAPGAVPSELVAAVDRSVIRRGSPEVGPGTVVTVRDEDGQSVELGEVRLTDNYRLFRVEFDEELEPGATYDVDFETVEFIFGEDEYGEEDLEIIEFDEALGASIETPEFQLVDVSSVRPVGAYGHVELRFSAPVDVDAVDEHLDWSFGGLSPTEVTYDGDGGRVVDARLRSLGNNFALNVNSVALTGGDQLSSSSGGDPLDGIDESLEVGSQSEGLEIREVGLYERANTPTVRILCHDPNYGDERTGYWDRELRTRIRQVSHRCDVDTERALELVELGVDADISVVDHQHGFDLVLELDEPGGPAGIAFRTGDWGQEVAELYEGHDEILELSFPEPELSIDADGRYLEREDWQRIPIRHRGVELIRVVVRHAIGQHFLFWLGGSDEMEARGSFAIGEQFLEVDAGNDSTDYSYIDMQELVGDAEPGAYQVEISAPYQGGLDDSHRFIISDIQLIAKRASHSEREVDEVWAWTIDADTAQPVTGVDLELVRENGRTLADCQTDTDGYCELSGNWGDLEQQPPFAVVAEGSNELAYVDWEDTRTEIVEGDVGGLDYAENPPYRGAIRGERTLYRPGETMEFAGFIRGEQYRAESGLPVRIELTDSRGDQAFRSVEETDAVGAVEFEHELSEMASTGTWNAEIFAGDEVIASQQVSVEEFVPERIDVELDVDDVVVTDGNGFSGAIDAEYFFGTPAANNEFEVQCRFEHMQPFRDRWPQYQFGPFEDTVDSTTTYADGRLDDQGRADFLCDPSELDERAVYSVAIKASVFEAGSGRPSRTEGEATMLPGHRLVGLRSPDERVDADDGARLEGIVVDADGALVDDVATIDIEIGGIRYSSTRIRRQGRWSWERERHESVDRRETVDVDGGEFSLRAASRGNSVGIYVRSGIDGAMSEFEVSPPRRFWGWWSRGDTDPRPDDPAHIQIDGPDELVLGESAEYSFEAPSEGRALVATETGRVDDWQWIDVEAGLNNWDVTVEYFDPNVYVSVLFVPTGDNAPQSFDRGFGVRRVDVNRSNWRADVDLDVPDERQPGESLEIDVDAQNVGPEAKVAVAAVDRGILSMAAHDYEDPLDQLFAIRALGIDTFDTVGWYADVSPERFGGGGLAEPQMAPEAIMPVRPTAMWSGLVDLDEQGRASVDFAIPDFRGELEITAVVVDGRRLGEATERTTIRDPLALQATAPRFATHGDRLRIPVSVTNTTESPVDVDLSAQALPDIMLSEDDTATLRIVSADSGQLQLDADERGEIFFEVEVTGRAGVPELLFEASGNGEESQHVASVPIVPDGPTEVQREHHSVDDGVFDVLAELHGWLPTSETTELWLTSIPRAPAFEHLEYVLRYPYIRLGVNLYNTVARVRPVIYLDRLLEAADPASEHRGVDWRVSRGIRSIERLQRPSGRFTYWSSGSVALNPWGQAYVLDMLTSAEDAGYDVPQWVLRDGLDWLDRRVQRRHDIEDLDLGMWVLSRQGRPNRRAARALLDRLPDAPSGRDHERALLATASLYLAGDETVEDDLRDLIANPAPGDAAPRISDDFYSSARHQGLALEVGIELFGTDDELLEDLVEEVADRLVDARVGTLNVHELGWAITSLGRWAEARSESIPEARLYAAGAEVEPDIVADDGSRSWQLHRASEYPEVNLVFEEEFDGPISVFRRTEGVHERSSQRFGRENLQLERNIRDADGDAVDLDNIEVGDLMYVELVASHDEDGTLRNLALVDRLPGGFEIEDPRPDGDVRPDWFDSRDEWSVDHFDVRDDRLQAYGSIPRDQTVRFVYSMRATSAGTYSTPPAELTSMYQHDRWARIAGEPVEIHRP